MSLTKLLKAPIKLFKKDVITFLIIRRYDLGTIQEKLQYIAMKPTCSISMIRQKLWHLLELPDYCEEIIVLKSQHNVEIPLTELRRGNSPQSPYILEVWLPSKPPGNCTTSAMFNNMLTCKGITDPSILSAEEVCDVNMETPESIVKRSTAKFAMSTETIAQIKHRVSNSIIYPDIKTKREFTCKSKTSLFRVSGKKSHDNFANILLKIQSDLSTLSNKINHLENKITN